MRVDLSIWDKLTRVMLVLFVVAVMMGVAATYYPLLKQNERMRAVVYRLETEIREEENRQRQLSSSIEAMVKDPATVERLAREKLGYAKPGETVIRFESPRVYP